MPDEQAHEVAQAVHGDPSVLGKKVAGMVDLAAVRVDKWIIIRAVRLDLDLSCGTGQTVHNRSKVLGKAAQRVTILDQLAGAMPAVARSIVAYEFRSRYQLCHLGSRPNLPCMRLDRVNERRKALAGRKHRLRIERVNADS